MLLAVDIGNSSIKFGVFDGDDLISKISIPTRLDATAFELRHALGDNLAHPFTAAIICSVVPEADDLLTEFLEREIKIEPVLVRNDFDFGLKINYEPLASAGTDRLVNSFAAAEKYGVPCIVCSFGTATTIDVVTADRVFLGGVIAPGMGLMAKALHLNTSKLPDVAIEKPATVIQNTTVGSIQSGIVYGYVGLVGELISRIKNETGDDSKVIATGGFASMIAENTALIDILNENLLLDGLRILHDKSFEFQL